MARVSIGYATVSGYAVMVTEKHDDTWTKDVIVLAEFGHDKGAAERFLDAFKALVLVANPTLNPLTWSR